MTPLATAAATDGPSAALPPAPTLRVRGRVDYAECFAAMQTFTEARTADTRDELWLVEHPPVYTRGRNAKEPAPAGAIPCVASDRGGDITYHGPGQVVLYVLLDLARRRLGVRSLVALLEQSVIDVVADFGVAGERRPGAPGVYVAGRKLAALGLRVRRGCSYHGVSLNVDMDLAPFSAIAPCGYRGLEVTQLVDLTPGLADALDAMSANGTRGATIGMRLAAQLIRNLGYNPAHLPAAETSQHGHFQG